MPTPRTFIFSRVASFLKEQQVPENAEEHFPTTDRLSLSERWIGNRINESFNNQSHGE
jgi:hypothetical protein